MPSIIFVVPGSCLEVEDAAAGTYVFSGGRKGFVVLEVVVCLSRLDFLVRSCKGQIFSTPVGQFLSFLYYYSSGSCGSVYDR